MLVRVCTQVAESGALGVGGGVERRFFAPARARRYSRLNADRLVAVTDAASNVTVYGYDTEGNMVNITDAANHETALPTTIWDGLRK